MSITAQLLDMAINLIDKIGYLGLSLILISDNAGVPIPSEAILALAGAAARNGKMNMIWVIILGIVMQTIGTALAYTIGYYGGGPLVKKYGKYILISAEDYDKTQAWFAKRGPRAIFISRVTPVVRTFMGFAAGAAKMDFRSFIIQSVAGSIFWTIIWAGFGYILGDSWRHYYEYMHYVDYVVMVVIAALIAYWVWKHFARRQQALKTGKSSNAKVTVKNNKE